MKKINKVLFFLFLLFITIAIVDFANWIYSKNIIKNLPTDSVWICNEPHIVLTVDKEGELYGTAHLNNTVFSISFSSNFKGDFADIICFDDSEEYAYFLFKGRFRVSWLKNKIVMKDIVVYDENIISYNVMQNSSITFYRQ